VNLLDLCGASVPATLHEDGTPFGITFIAPGGQDALAASLAKAFHAVCGVAAGAQAKLEPLV
jgi:allophanate hydrolase